MFGIEKSSASEGSKHNKSNKAKEDGQVELPPKPLDPTLAKKCKHGLVGLKLEMANLIYTITVLILQHKSM